MKRDKLDQSILSVALNCAELGYVACENGKPLSEVLANVRMAMASSGMPVKPKAKRP